MKNNRNKSYPNKQINADIVNQGGAGTDIQRTMMMVNDLKSLWYVTNTRCVNSFYGKNELTKDELKKIRVSIRKLIEELEPIVRPNKDAKLARAMAKTRAEIKAKEASNNTVVD